MPFWCNFSWLILVNPWVPFGYVENAGTVENPDLTDTLLSVMTV